MRLHRYLFMGVLALALVPLLNDVRAGEMDQAEVKARLLLFDLERKVLAEQYHNLQMKTFEAGLELRLKRIEHKHLALDNLAKEKAEKVEAIQTERLHLFEQETAMIRERLLNLHREMASLEKAVTRKHEFSGVWIGHEQGKDAKVRLRIEGDRARLECPSEDTWYKGRFSAEPEGGELWDVTFVVEESSEPSYQGKKSRGLARLEKDRCVLAANEPGEPSRPNSFEPSPDTKVFVFERE